MYIGGNWEYHPGDIALPAGDVTRLVQMYPQNPVVPGLEDAALWEPYVVGLQRRGVRYERTIYPPNATFAGTEEVEDDMMAWYEVIDEWTKHEQDEVVYK